MPLDKVLDFCKPPFPRGYSGNNDDLMLALLGGIINEVMHVKCFI